MKTIKALVTADLHLGDKMYGLKEREQDVYNATREVFQIANSLNCDIALLAGDIFDTARPPAAAVSTLHDCVENVFHPVFGIEGNHDKVGTGEWLQVCGITPLENNEYDPSLLAYGINYAKPSELIERLEDCVEMVDRTGSPIVVLLLHCGFAEMGDPFAAEITFEKVMPYLKKMGTKIVCVGHIHKRITQNVTIDGHTVTFIQPGSIERNALNEEPDKFVDVIEYNATGLVSHICVPLSTRKFNEIRIDTKEDYASFLGSVDCKEVKESMNIVRVRSSIDGAISGIEQAMKRVGGLFRILTYCDEVAVEEFDRDNQIVSLESVVESYFDKGTPVYEMLIEFLRTPEKTAEIAENFMTQKKQLKQEQQ